MIPEAPAAYRPGSVRLLAVGWWVLSALLAGDLLLRGEPGTGWALGLALLVFSAAGVHALFWQPEVRVDAEGVELVNVLRRVRLPWSSVEDLDTRWALSLGAGGRRWTSWAAPASGRRVRPVSRRDTPWADRGPRGSRQPGPRFQLGRGGGPVGTAWQRWQDRPGAVTRTGPRGPGNAAAQGLDAVGAPTVRWNRPVLVSLGVSGALVAAAGVAAAFA